AQLALAALSELRAGEREAAAKLLTELGTTVGDTDDYSELELDSRPPSASLSIRSASFARVCRRSSSASVASEVVNGPVGGRCPPGKRSRKVRKRFMRRAYLAGLRPGECP